MAGTTSPNPQQISEAARRELDTQYLRVRVLEAALRMRERLLTPEERAGLGGDNLNAFAEHWKELGTVRIWMQLKQVSFPRAVIELARRLNFMSETDADWLLREIGEQPAKPETVPPDRPVWNADTGELRLNGEVIRNVRLKRQPSNIQRLLDAFQECDWPQQIDDPLPGGADPKRLRDTVDFLNENLQRIRFQVRHGGTTVLWTTR